jgi:hypothetical protein
MSHPLRGPRTLTLLALLVVLCAACFASVASALDAGTSGPRSAVAPAIRKAAASPVASGRPGYWAQASCSYKEELAYENEDWSAMTDGAYNMTNGESALDTCLLVGGGITARDEARFGDEPGTGPVYVYAPGRGSTIVGGVLSLTLHGTGGVAYVSSPENNTQPANVIASCTGCATTTESVGFTRSGAAALYVGATCTAPQGESVCSPNEPADVNAEAIVRSATILLHNDSKPSASGVAGTVLADPTSGTAGLSFTASEKEGPGIYRVAVTIDGTLVSSMTPNENTGRCVPLGSYEGALVFEPAQPCPDVAGVSLEIPTTGLSDGEHQLSVVVEDAAGNATQVYGGAIHVLNHPQVVAGPGGTPPLTGSVTTPPSAVVPVLATANGTPASESARISAGWRGAAHSTLDSPYGHSRQIVGRLSTPAGVPIAGAVIEVSERTDSLGASTSAWPTVRSAADGTFSVKVPGSVPSAAISLVYRSRLGSPEPSATAGLTLRVPASVHLTVSSRITEIHHTIELTGALAGAIPPSGKAVVFEARAASGGAWVEFHNAMAHGKGVFHASHRFVFPGPARYDFRVVCRKEAGFPFLQGTSNMVSVFER